jgi:hypothetical protein
MGILKVSEVCKVATRDPHIRIVVKINESKILYNVCLDTFNFQYLRHRHVGNTNLSSTVTKKKRAVRCTKTRNVQRVQLHWNDHGIHTLTKNAT